MPNRSRIVRSNFRGPFRGTKRSTEWFSSADFTVLNAVPGGGVLLEASLSQAALLDVAPCTIVRTVGQVMVQSDQVAATEVCFGAMGMAVVSDQARAAGIASLPTPITDEPDDAWFVYVPWAVGGSVAGGPGFLNFAFDSRAQRKIEDHAIVIVLENAAAGGIGCDIATKFRILFKLH